MMLDRMKSVFVVISVSRKMTARIGVVNGRMMRKKICTWLAPSISADSSISLGSVSKKPFMSHVFTLRAVPR